MPLSVSIALLLQAIAPQATTEPSPVKPDIGVVGEERRTALTRADTTT